LPLRHAAKPKSVRKCGRAAYAGRCVNKDYGAIGCAVDVLSFADTRCSGRPRCTITVADFSLRGIRPCPQDLTSYFEAGYRCVPGRWRLL